MKKNLQKLQEEYTKKTNSITIHYTQQIKTAKEKAKQTNYSQTIKTSSYIGIVFAVIAFAYVGPWYDEKYGFSGSFGAALSAAIIVMFAFVILGFIAGWVIQYKKEQYVENLKKEFDNAIIDLKNKYENDCSAYFSDARPLFSKFSNNHYIQEIISSLTSDFSVAIKKANRANYIEKITHNTHITIAKDHIGNLDFRKERLSELTTEEISAAAQVIGESVKNNIIQDFPKDISGTIPTVTVKYDSNSFSGLSVIISYSCENGFFEKEKEW